MVGLESSSGILSVMMMRVRTRRRPVLPILVCLLLFALLLRGCLFGGRGQGEGAGDRWDEAEPADLWDAAGFVWDGGRCRYESDGVVYGRTGIDVSDHQGYVDWQAVASDGIDFALLRVGYRGNTEGGLFLDERFEANLADARAAGIACGAYFYSQATSVEEAREEAAFVLGVLAGRPLEYPVAFDHEVEPGTRVAGISREVCAQAADAFCQAIREGGYEPMLYGNTYDLERVGAPEADGCAIWCAEYDNDPSYQGRIRLWQYTGDGVVAGIDTPVDMNLDLGDVPVP